MAPHVRGALFFATLLLAPAVFALGDRLGGTAVAVLLAGGAVALSTVWMRRGGPPAGPAAP